MKYIKIYEDIKDDTAKSIEYEKYINKLVVFRYTVSLNYGIVKKIYFSDHFVINSFGITIKVANDKFYTDYCLKSVEILKEVDSVEEAQEYISILKNQNKYNL